MLISENESLKAIPFGWQEPLRSYELYLRALGRAHRTVDTRIRHLRTMARDIEELGATDPATTTEPILIQWSGIQNWARETRHAYHASIRGFFAWWTKDSEQSNPAVELRSIRRPVPPPRPAPEDVITAAVATADKRTELILRLAAELGLRAQEIAALHTRDIETDEKTGWATLTITGKGDQIRILPVPPMLNRRIHQQAPEGGWVFPGNINGHLSARWVGKLAAKVLPDGWTLHTLRHRFATTAYNNAASRDIIALQQALGHQSIITTQRYTRSLTRLHDIVAATIMKGSLQT